MTPLSLADAEYDGVHGGIVDLLESAHRAAARSVNTLMTATYWEIGRRIVEFKQDGKERSAYGDTLIKRLSVDLSSRFGRGYSARNLEQMRAFYQTWGSERIPQTVSAELKGAGKLQSSSAIHDDSMRIAGPQWSAFDKSLRLKKDFPLPWSAYVRLLSVKNVDARHFYETEALRCGWSVRQLDRQIGSQFYERIALSRNKAEMLRKGGEADLSDVPNPECAMKDPFVLEFLALKDEYSESEFEEALIKHLADFLLELGDDFAFVGRQRRLRIDDSWFSVDLLLFHRRLKSLLVIDLKVGKFSYADAGQMHFYLNYAREHWMKPGENPPIGLILCAEKGASEAHYALDGLPNKVLAAEYQMVLPEEKLLADELARTRQALEARDVGRRGRADERQ
jgi:predicted nuclease of restriction endonuclease-like (RecB) superfamily